jgi:formylglycine-generating enzyme required for sulfatase activity
MTGSAVLLPWLALGLAAPANASPRGPAGALLTLPAAQSRAAYFRPLTVQLGSTDEEVLAALLRCKREPLGERCDETTFTSESPPHHERVAAFWMARTETTVAEYARCVSAGRCQPPAFQGGARRFERALFPVTLVSFDDAERYCSFRGGRLPTEAEFERAARGAARRSYPWGQTYSRYLANHGRLGVDPSDASDGFAELAPVGSFPSGATPEGVLDLAGNVAEWTADAFVPAYGLPPTSERAVRGGHFANAAPFLRGAARTSKNPSTREPTLGFRCVWSAAPP